MNLTKAPPRPVGRNTWFARSQRERQRLADLPLPTKPYKPARSPGDF